MQLLTRREREIVEMVVEGCMPFKSVAITLKIALHTTHNHIKAIYQKWNVRCLSELIRAYNHEMYWMIRKNPNEPAPEPFIVHRRDPKVRVMNTTTKIFELKKAA